MSARFEVVRTDAVQPWHARFRAANGRIVWTTENYARRKAALNAVAAMVDPLYGYLIDNGTAVGCLTSRNSWEKTDHAVAEIRDVDERQSVTP